MVRGKGMAVSRGQVLPDKEIILKKDKVDEIESILYSGFHVTKAGSCGDDYDCDYDYEMNLLKHKYM